jgi:hypothetical protein
MTNITPAFPLELLDRPIVERMTYFDKSLILHPIFKRVQANLLQAIRYPGGATLIIFHGPPSAGKTTMRRYIEQKLLHEFGGVGTTLAAVAGTEAVSQDASSFNWRDYYVRTLIVADALLPPDQKLNYNCRGLKRNSEGLLLIDRSILVTDLRRAVEICFQALRLKAWLVDEAQHTKQRVSGRSLLHQMDTIKSIATLTQTLHVLIGNYELLDMSAVSGQLCWRSIDIEMPRYHINTHTQIADYQEVLRSFQCYLPVKKTPDLASRYEYFWEKTVGCIGVLKNWLTRSLAAVLEDDKSTLTVGHLKRYQPTAYKLRQLDQEISEGEKLRDAQRRGAASNIPG